MGVEGELTSEKVESFNNYMPIKIIGTVVYNLATKVMLDSES